MNSQFLLTVVVFFPLLGSLIVMLLRRSDAAAFHAAVAVSAIELGLASVLFALSSGPASAATVLPGFFMVQDLPWIHRFGIRYTLGVDGISLLMVVLTALIILVSVIISRNTVGRHVAWHYALLLLLATGVMGLFLALDLFLFYLFWEVMLIPMLLLIGIWGSGRPVRSAIKFFVFTMVGSLLMLLAIIALFLLHGAQTGQYTFALGALVHTSLSPAASAWLFAAFLLAFAIKVPVFPLHSWMPDAYRDASTAGSLILAALLAKTGAYGMIRFAFPLFPAGAAQLTPVLLALSVISIWYGSWIAYAQNDMKRLVAYSSFGHMGFIVLGIAAWTPVSLSGSVIQMVNHGITTGGLFILAGMLEERRKTTDIDAFGGLWDRVPYLSGFFLLISIASVGLPGLNNFVGEFLVLAGVFRVSPWASVLAFCGVVPVLIYVLRMLQKVLFLKEVQGETVRDVSLQEGFVLSVLALIIVFLGLYPVPLLDLVKTPVQVLTGGMP